eukprot:7386149-Prymnesium_polylepis.1
MFASKLEAAVAYARHALPMLSDPGEGEAEEAEGYGDEVEVEVEQDAARYGSEVEVEVEVEASESPFWLVAPPLAAAEAANASALVLDAPSIAELSTASATAILPLAASSSSDLSHSNRDIEDFGKTERCIKRIIGTSLFGEFAPDLASVDWANQMCAKRNEPFIVRSPTLLEWP